MQSALGLSLDNGMGSSHAIVDYRLTWWCWRHQDTETSSGSLDKPVGQLRPGDESPGYFHNDPMGRNKAELCETAMGPGGMLLGDEAVNNGASSTPGMADHAVNSGADQTPGTADDVRWMLGDHQNSVRNVTLPRPSSRPGAVRPYAALGRR